MCVLYRKSLLAVRYENAAAAAERVSLGSGCKSAAGGSNTEGLVGHQGKESAGVCVDEGAEHDVSQGHGCSGTGRGDGSDVNGGIGGDVNTLMSVDSGRVVNLLLSFHELWSLPMQMVLALYMLYTQVGLARTFRSRSPRGRPTLLVTRAIAKWQKYEPQGLYTDMPNLAQSCLAGVPNRRCLAGNQMTVHI